MKAKPKTKAPRAKSTPKQGPLYSRELFELIVVDSSMEEPRLTAVTGVSFDEAERAASTFRKILGGESLQQLVVVPMMADGTSQFDGCDLIGLEA